MNIKWNKMTKKRLFVFREIINSGQINLANRKKYKKVNLKRLFAYVINQVSLL